MDSRVPENIAFIQFQLHPNYSTTSTGIVGCCGVKFGCNRNMIKCIFLESGNIIDYHSRLDFCRPFYSLPTQASNKPCFFLPLLIITPSFNSTWISTPTLGKAARDLFYGEGRGILARDSHRKSTAQTTSEQRSSGFVKRRN